MEPQQESESISDVELAGMALAAGWTATRVSLYDEEGVEGWEWTSPENQSFVPVIGDWSQPTFDNNEELRDAVFASLGRQRAP